MYFGLKLGIIIIAFFTPAMIYVMAERAFQKKSDTGVFHTLLYLVVGSFADLALSSLFYFIWVLVYCMFFGYGGGCGDEAMVLFLVLPLKIIAWLFLWGPVWLFRKELF